MLYLLLAAPLVVLLALYFAVRRWLRWPMWAGVLTASLCGAACGGFLLTAASAMSTAANPAVSALKGCLAGGLAGAVMACSGFGIEFLWRRRSGAPREER